LDRPNILLGALVAAILVIAVATSAASALARRRKETASLSAIDFVRSSFASQLNRGVPMDELLLQMVEALRDGFKLDAAEVWLCEAGALRLAAAEPTTARSPIPITPAEETIATNARVSSAASAKVWLPALLDGRNGTCTTGRSSTWLRSPSRCGCSSSLPSATPNGRGRS